MLEKFRDTGATKNTVTPSPICVDLSLIKSIASLIFNNAQDRPLPLNREFFCQLSSDKKRGNVEAYDPTLSFKTNLLNAGSTTNVQTIIQNMPMVMIRPMLAIPSCGEKARPAKLDAVVNAP